MELFFLISPFKFGVGGLIEGLLELGLETSRAELSERVGSARFGSASERAELGSARYFCEPENQARLGSVEAREPAREPH